MADKKAFVFDTNFIIQNKRLDNVVENLKNDYIVYVTQVSIDERIAQKCRETKEKFDEVEDCAKKHHDIVKITKCKTFEEVCASYKTATPKAYRKIFADNIIPYKKDGSTFQLILERANTKEPPFSKNKDASDKGFKDCLLWISLLEYFKENGENQVVFLTDDKSAFRNHIDFLTDEFKDFTGKGIEFKPNSFYNELINIKDDTQEKSTKEEIPNVAQIRDRISGTIYDLCGCQEYDSWGNQYWQKYFIMNTLSTPVYAKTVFDSLPEIISSHIFEQRVSAYKIFDFDDRLQGNVWTIPMEKLENAHYLHEEIKEKYPSYLEQFYLTVSNILNSNYDFSQNENSHDDLPF